MDTSSLCRSLFSFILLLAIFGQGQGVVEDYCINCICVDGCQITYAFWVDSGKPTIAGDYPESPNAFQNCYNSYECSAGAIRTYMSYYEQDCNNDGQINCLDHAAIHRVGPYACTGIVPQDFASKVLNCLNYRK